LWQVGLFFMGVVKTASKYFPKKFLVQWCEEHSRREDRGKHKLLKTVRDGVNVYALGWSDKKGKHVVFTDGTDFPAEPSRRTRHRAVQQGRIFVKQRYEKVVPRPLVIKEMFDALSAIDVNDHLRQGSLEIERQWIVRSWVLRLFGTILGMITTNAFNLYIYTMTPHQEVMDFNTFLGNLSYELIFNKFYVEDERVLRRRPREDDDLDEEPVRCEVGRLIDLPQYEELRGSSRRARLTCRAEGCGRKSSFYCKTCSEKSNRLICYCSGDQTCMMYHDPTQYD